MQLLATLRNRRPRGSTSSLGRWFSLLWLIWLVFPALELYNGKRSLLEYLYGSLLLAVFVATFVWSFFLKRWIDPNQARAYRIPSLIGMAVCYAVMLLLLPVIGWSGVGMLIYAGSFAGVQRSFLPGAVAIGISALFSVPLLLLKELSPWTAASMIFFTIVAVFGNHLSYREIHANFNLRRSQEEVARVAKIAERERIARDLHDLLGHTLSVIVLKSELASKLAQKDLPRAISEIQDVERIARESLQEVRSAVRGYRSSGLEAELAGIRLACEAADLKLELYLEPLELEWAVEQTLAFVLREATTNAIRHAGARHLWVSLERGQDFNAVSLGVSDDGTGEITPGNGLRGMRERLEVIGGGLEIAANRKGLTVRIPGATVTSGQRLHLEGTAEA